MQVLLENVTETAILSGVLRATVSKVMSSYMNHGKTASAKRNSQRKSILKIGIIVH
jgi:hypothetical protein